MKTSERGPFARIRWFCNDGSVLPPKAYACVERGGGHQHGEWSDKTKQLRAQGYLIATLLAATVGVMLAVRSMQTLQLGVLRTGLVTTLFEGRVHGGRERLVWHGTDDSGEKVASGVYFVLAETESDATASKIVMVR